MSEETQAKRSLLHIGSAVLLFSHLWRFDILRLKPEVEESVSPRKRMSKN
jgi:hypothetical protein